jgi:CelD/BcsL family acetyltransferase involved in cellulose biosynthesis
LGLDLPSSWETYLDSLNGKQRHEVRRKLRRLEEAAEVRYCVVDRPDETEGLLDAFFQLFRISRSDKEAFLTERMTAFFQGLVRAMAREGLLRLGLLYLDNALAAATLSFDYNGQVLLYNNGFDPVYERLSVGLLSKVYGLRHSIEQGRCRYDFLKGNEIYKYRLGGQEVPLHRCRITL